MAAVVHVIKVNNTSPNSAGNVTIAIPPVLAVRVVTGTTDTVLDGDTLVKYTNAGTITITVPAGLPAPHSSVHIPVSTGDIKFVAAGGVSINNANGDNGSNGQYAPVTLFSLAIDEFYLGGNTATV